MKIFGIILIGLVLVSVVAWVLKPSPPSPAITPLIWVSDDNPSRREQIELFNRDNPGIQLHLDPDNGGMEKVIIQSLAGIGPDVFDCYNPQDLEAYIKADIALDITDELKKAGIDVEKDVWRVIQSDFTYKGRVYGLPNSSVDALWFNKGIFDRMGIEYPSNRPWTWDEFIPLAQKLTIRDSNGRIVQYGLCYDAWAWKTFLCQWGGRVYSPDGSRCTLDTPQAIAAVQFMHDLVYKYRVMPSPAELAAMSQEGGWGSSSIKLLGAGRAATAIGGRWWLCTLRDYDKLRLGAVESPHGPLREFWGYGKATLINKHSPHRQQALKFLLYLAGEHYNRLDNHQADGLPPMKKYCTDEYLVNNNRPDEPYYYPEEDFHAVFRDVLVLAEPEAISPFVKASTAVRIISLQLDLVMRDAKSPEQGMKDAAREVNEEIEKTLRKNPALRRQFEELRQEGHHERP